MIAKRDEKCNTYVPHPPFIIIYFLLRDAALEAKDSRIQVKKGIKTEGRRLKIGRRRVNP
jgi:hypothetical protein